MYLFSCEAHFSHNYCIISNKKMKKISTVAEKWISLSLLLLWFPNFSKGQIFTGCNYDTLYRHPAEVGFICTFSLLIYPSITLRSSKFRNRFIISSKYFHMVFYLKWETYSGPFSFEVQGNDIWTDKFNHLRCHSNSTA